MRHAKTVLEAGAVIDRKGRGRRAGGRAGASLLTFLFMELNEGNSRLPGHSCSKIAIVLIDWIPPFREVNECKRLLTTVEGEVLPFRL